MAVIDIWFPTARCRHQHSTPRKMMTTTSCVLATISYSIRRSWTSWLWLKATQLYPYNMSRTGVPNLNFGPDLSPNRGFIDSLQNFQWIRLGEYISSKVILVLQCPFSRFSSPKSCHNSFREGPGGFAYFIDKSSYLFWERITRRA